jgi:hypothetical protein
VYEERATRPDARSAQPGQHSTSVTEAKEGLAMIDGKERPNWIASPWNHGPGAPTLEHDIQIHDVTLRDGEQQTGVAFSAADKIRIAEALAEAGVHRIEAGLPAVSPEDDKAVRTIAGLGLPSTILSSGRSTAAWPVSSWRSPPAGT